MIYFDNAATTFQKPPEVEQAVLHAFHTVGNAGRGAHGVTLDASRMIYETREQLARLFGISDASRIAFTCNATEALNIAINGLFESGDHVITSVCEHNSVLRPLYREEKHGVELSFLSADKHGQIRYEELPLHLEQNTKAVVITHASNLTGNVTDLQKISTFTRKHGLLLVVDASQTAGIIPINVEESGIDILCFTGHKGLYGPQGTGGIYVRDGISLRPLKAGGSGVHSFDKDHPNIMPTALEAGTLNGHGIAGLHASTAFLLKTGVAVIHAKEQSLAERFVEGIQDIQGLSLYGDYETKERVAIVTLNIRDIDSASLSDWLWEDYEIATRSGAHCAPLMHEHFHTAEQGAVRFSFSCYNTEEEVDTAICALHELASE